jgi:DNA-binding MarR family transcriptional regulator
MSDLPIPALLGTVKNDAVDELRRGLIEQGFDGIREGHGCVFGYIDPEGSRLTYLAETSGLTKQAVGEAVDDLQKLGYVERIPDPTDGRAKIVRLTSKGLEARSAGRAILERVERRWAAEVGEERVAEMRETLEDIFALVSGHTPTPA